MNNLAPENATMDDPVEPDSAADPEIQPDSELDDTHREARAAIEAIVLVCDEPVAASMLAQIVELPVDSVEALVAQLADTYEQQGRGFELVKVAGGYRFQTKAEMAPYVERFVLEGQVSRLSAAALETLAIVAYKQPISRAQVSAIRGVAVDGVMRTLEQRGYIIEIARDPGPGNAVLFGTTPLFLERLGLGGVDELPALVDFVPGADVVEALEVGLRIEPAEAAAAESATDASAEAAEAGDDLVVDLTDDASVDLAADEEE